MRLPLVLMNSLVIDEGDLPARLYLRGLLRSGSVCVMNAEGHPSPVVHPLIRSINETEVAAGRCALWWLGQHGFVVKLGTAVVWLDPFLSPVPGRLVPPACPPEAVTGASLILGSHDHIDHIDRAIWPALGVASPSAVFVVPEPVRESVIATTALPAERVIGAVAGQSFVQAGVTITPLPAAHEQLDRDPGTGLYPYLGFIVEANGFRLYHAGDTCLYEGLHARLRARPCDLFILPINGRDGARLAAGCVGNMTWQEAADLAGALMPGAVIPAHYDMFAGNTAPVEAFVEYVRVKYPQQPVILPRYDQPVHIGVRRAAVIAPSDSSPADNTGFLALARRRYSVRAYSRQPIPRDALDRCIEAARLAPSACNSQPWTFIMVDQPALREAVADAAGEGILPLNHFVRQAPILVVAVAETPATPARVGAVVKDKPFRLMDVAIAAEHLCLQAADEGLGTCMLGWFNEARVREILGIPASARPVLLLTLGYPATAGVPVRKRKPSDAILAWNRHPAAPPLADLPRHGGWRSWFRK